MGESPQEQPQETSGPKTLWSNGYVKFGLAALIYLLWVVWVGNYWLLLGLGVLFDIYVTQKVRWAFWKSKKEKPSAANEWIDAGIFAVVAAMLIRTFFIEAFTIPTSSMEKTLLVGDYLFVSKVSYGPRMPNTPLAIPFTHHTMPFTQYGRPYVEWARWPYRRLAGLGEVQRNDVMVFNYPEGDTVAGDIQAKSYYQLCREYGQAAILENQLLRNYGQRPGPILVRPVDKRENYIKRCVGLPGDIIEVRGTQLYVNGQPQEKVGDTQFKYALASTLVFRRDSLLDMGISYEDQDLSAPLTRYYSDLLTANPRLKDFISLRNDSIILNTNILVYPLTESMVRRFSGYGFVKAIEPIIQPDSLRSRSIFPQHEGFAWNEDFFGPVEIPAKGKAMPLTLQNLPLYERAIRVYEGNKLEVRDGQIFINDQPADSYAFRMDYYWLMGDSRHNSADSRAWGFVPEDHMLGKAVMVWFSYDKDMGSVRWSRIFNSIE